MPCPFSSLVPRRTAPSVGRRRLGPMDGIDRFAVVLLALGASVFVFGLVLEPPASAGGAFLQHYPDWAPGLVTDGILLLVVNGVLRRHERRRVLLQVASLSREFALDAVRRARAEGWLVDGSMEGLALARTSLPGADLTEVRLAGADLSFSDLSGASLAYADLRGTDLTGANLAGTDLRWTDLTGARLRWADVRGALLDGAHLDGIDARFAAVDPRAAGHPAFATDAVPGGFLDDAQLGAIERTFDLLAARGTDPIERFYAWLFEALPEARPLFRSDARAQARKFLQSLRVIVSALHEPNKHVAVLQRLGDRHRAYGVAEAHYPVVAETLLAVLEEALGSELDASAREAWRRALGLITTVMTSGAGRRDEMRLQS